MIQKFIIGQTKEQKQMKNNSLTINNWNILKMSNRMAKISSFALLGAVMGTVILLPSAFIPFSQSSLRAGTLSEDLNLLLTTLPSLTAQRQKIQASINAIDEAQSGYYPVLNFTGQAGSNRLSTPAIRDSLDGIETLNHKVATVEIRQNIFNGMQTSNTVESAEYGLEISKISYEQSIQESLLAGTKAYLEVLRNIELLAVSNQKQETIRTQMELEDERVRSGAGVSVDVLQAKSRLQRAKDETFGFERQLSRAVAAFVKSFGFEPDLNAMQDTISDQVLVPASLEQSLEIAKNGNPSINRTVEDAKVVSARLDAARSGYYPNIDLVGSHEWSYDNNGSEGRNTDAKGYVEMNWDLFSGFATKSAVAKMSNNWGEALNNIDTARLKVEEDTRAAWARLEHANKRRQLYDNGTILAEELLIARQQLRDSGKETALGVLDAQNEVFQAKINTIGANYDAKVSALELSQAIGLLSPESIALETPGYEVGINGHSATSTTNYEPKNIIEEANPEVETPADSLDEIKQDDEIVTPSEDNPITSIPSKSEPSTLVQTPSIEDQLPVKPIDFLSIT